MNSMRPLLTITILVGVGYYLYTEINKGPARSHGGKHSDAATDVPPLAAVGGGATLAQDSAAPAWSPNNPPAPATLTASPSAPGTAATPAPPANTALPLDATKGGMPEVPPIPELPEMPQTSVAATTPLTSPPAAAVPGTAFPALPAVAPAVTNELPKAAPDSRYGGAAGPDLGGAPGSDATGLPALPMIPGASPSADGTTLPGAEPGAAAIAPTNPATNNALRATPGASATPPAMDRYGAPMTSNSTTGYPIATPALSAPATSTAPVTPEPPAAAQPADRYGAGGNAALGPPVTSPLSAQPPAAAGASFAANWPAIQAALDRRDLKQAHQLLSKWHGNDTLTPEESQRVETLLGELAGTVIYSTEHQLEPARVVKPGETLEAIAKEYNVPWQLLAKINGITSANTVQPGQSLKVVRGPFSAVVDLRHNELTLEVDGRYAGTFSIAPTSSVPIAEGQWLVEQKLNGVAMGITQAAYATAASSADRLIVLRSTTGNGVTPPATLTIAANPQAGAATGAALKVAPQDAEDLSDILSIGSRVVVRK